MPGKTITEKIFARSSNLESVVPGQFVYARPDMLVIVDPMWPAIKKSFDEIGTNRVWDPNKVAFVIDHCVPAGGSRQANSVAIHSDIREFVKAQGIEKFYDIGRQGISHQLAADKALALPGMLYVCDDGQGTSLGAFGSLAIPLSSEVAAVLAAGEHWFKVPDTQLFTISGKLRGGVMARDIIQKIMTDLGPEGASYKMMEFCGPTVSDMSIDERETLCNLVQIVGAKSAIINPDQKILDYLQSRAKREFTPTYSDSDAIYSERFTYDVKNLEPLVAAPPDALNTKPVSELGHVEVNSAYIGSCTSGHIEDLRITAKILNGRKVKQGVRLFVVPSSQDVYIQAAEEGLLQVFAKSEATVLAPGCTLCWGYSEPLRDGETRIASSSVNYQGRMGSNKAKIYLSNPAVVAASALTGRITDPEMFLGR